MWCLCEVPGSTAPTTTLNPACPQGYVFYWFGCYRVHQELKSWSDAVQTCSTYRGNLVSIHSLQENAFLVLSLGTSYGSQPLWIGLRYQTVCIFPISPTKNSGQNRWKAFNAGRNFVELTLQWLSTALNNLNENNVTINRWTLSVRSVLLSMLRQNDGVMDYIA